MSMCGCNSSISSFLLLGAYSTATTRKILVHVCTRTNKREKQRESETSLFDNCILLHLYYINYHYIICFLRNDKKKGYHHQLNKQHVLTLYQYEKVNSGLLRYTMDSFIDRKSITIVIYTHIRLIHLDYIGLYYRILNEILECDYIRSFIGFFLLFIYRQPSFTW
jgi:hypothetical protein